MTPRDFFVGIAFFLLVCSETTPPSTKTTPKPSTVHEKVKAESESMTLPRADASSFFRPKLERAKRSMPGFEEKLKNQKASCPNEGGCKMFEICDKILSSCCDSAMDEAKRSYNYGE